ncbi:DUF5684 domain-containing protein [Microbacterium karelineae]|uniref:DUF5684 domain-containing protein n=1 Tax=Microbacterium karelineae TaxID=2654283 RepID=UPI0012EA0512|nr:DUF5684 domain-containing protein [Microbacterium karelineae]
MYDDYSYMDGAGGYAAVMAFLAIFGVVIFIVAIGGYVLTAWFLMKVFDKAGVEGKWRAWIPFYNTMVFMKLGDVNPWLLFFAFAGVIPYIGWIGSIFASVMVIIAAYRVGLKLQKEGAWVVLYIFLPIVWLGICAFDSSRWNHQVPAPSWSGNGFIGDKQVWAGIPASAPAGYAAPGYGQAPYGQDPYGQPSQPGYPPQMPQQPEQPSGGQPMPPQPPADPNQPPQPPADPNQPRPPQV